MVTLPRNTLPLSTLMRLNAHDDIHENTSDNEQEETTSAQGKTKVNLTPKRYEKRKKAGFSLVTHSYHLKRKASKKEKELNRSKTETNLDLLEPMLRTTEF